MTSRSKRHQFVRSPPSICSRSALIDKLQFHKVSEVRINVELKTNVVLLKAGHPEVHSILELVGPSI